MRIDPKFELFKRLIAAFLADIAVSDKTFKSFQNWLSNHRYPIFRFPEEAFTSFVKEITGMNVKGEFFKRLIVAFLADPAVSDKTFKSFQKWHSAHCHRPFRFSEEAFNRFVKEIEKIPATPPDKKASNLPDLE